MLTSQDIRKQIIIGAMLITVTVLHYSTPLSAHHSHVFYRQLYFVPLFFAAFWFGLRGAFAASLGITFLYLPFMAIHWGGLSSDDFSQVLDITLYNAVAVCMGIMRDREKAKEREKLEAVMAMAGCVGHELNNPLAIAIQATEILLEEMGRDSEHREELESIERNLKRMKDLIKRITAIDHIELMHYVGNSCIVDLNKSTR